MVNKDSHLHYFLLSLSLTRMRSFPSSLPILRFQSPSSSADVA